MKKLNTINKTLIIAAFISATTSAALYSQIDKEGVSLIAKFNQYLKNKIEANNYNINEIDFTADDYIGYINEQHENNRDYFNREQCKELLEAIKDKKQKLKKEGDILNSRNIQKCKAKFKI